MTFIPNWFESLTTGDATIGSYVVAAVLGMVILSVIGGIIGVLRDILEDTQNLVADQFTKGPRTSRLAQICLINLLPTMIAIGFNYGWISTGVWDENNAEVAGILIAAYYAFVGLLFAAHWLGERDAKRRAEKRNAQRK